MASTWFCRIATTGFLTAAAIYASGAHGQGTTYWPPSAQPVLVAPAPGASVIRTERSFDANGIETSRTEMYERHDAIGQSNGALSATSNSTTQWTTTSAPSTVWVTTNTPAVVTYAPVTYAPVGYATWPSAPRIASGPSAEMRR